MTQTEAASAEREMNEKCECGSLAVAAMPVGGGWQPVCAGCIAAMEPEERDEVRPLIGGAS